MIIDRRQRAGPAIARVRRTSREFRSAYAAGDRDAMVGASTAGLNALVVVFETLRNADDEGRITGGKMALATAYLVDGLTPAEQQAIYTAGRIDRTHPA